MNDAENLTKLLGHLPPAVFREFMADEFSLAMPDLDTKKPKKEQREQMEAVLSALGVGERQRIEEVGDPGGDPRRVGAERVVDLGAPRCDLVRSGVEAHRERSVDTPWAERVDGRGAAARHAVGPGWDVRDGRERGR